MAALAEQFLRMRFLEIAEADLGRRDVRGDREHRLVIAMAVAEAVDWSKMREQSWRRTFELKKSARSLNSGQDTSDRRMS
ncbi:hypothetical protein WT01_33060 [Burkholderia cepacia]|nr:hypothetical protein WT01_33060 [Burkholderia cepacia]